MVTGQILYLTVVLSVGISATVESVAEIAEESTSAAVESVVPVAVDPEPHAANVSVTPRAKINVTFFI